MAMLTNQSTTVMPLQPVVASYVYDEKTGLLAVNGRAVSLPITLRPTHYEIWLACAEATIWFQNDDRSEAALRIDGFSFDVFMHQVQLLYLTNRKLTDVTLTIVPGSTHPLAGEWIHLPRITCEPLSNANHHADQA